MSRFNSLPLILTVPSAPMTPTYLRGLRFFTILTAVCNDWPRIKKAGSRSCPPGKEVPRRRQGLFKLFGHYRKRELGFGERLYDGGLGVFRGGVARSSHLANEEVLRAFQHFLFAEGERLAAAEGNETLEDDGHFEEGPGAHALRILFEAVFPVVVRVEFAGFKKAQYFAGFCGTNDGTKANSHCVGLRDHDTQAARNNADHEVTFGSAVQNSVADLFNNAHTVVRVNDLVADLVIHNVLDSPLGDA